MNTAEIPRRCVSASPLLAALSNQEIVTDTQLQTLMRMQPDPATGLYSEDDQAALTMYLRDVCGELEARRRQSRVANANLRDRSGREAKRRRCGRLHDVIRTRDTSISDDPAAIIWIDDWLIREGVQNRTTLWIERAMSAWRIRRAELQPTTIDSQFSQAMAKLRQLVRAHT